jgi:hypothetical protein
LRTVPPLPTNPRFSRNAASLAAFTALTLLGCAGDIGDENLEGELDQQNASVTEMTWAACAKNGQNCSFTGTQQVRYGVTGNYKVSTFTNGVVCNASNFGTNRVRNAKCEIGTAVTPVSVPTDPHAGHDMTTMPTPTTTPTTPVTTTPVTTTPAATNPTMPMTGMGPTINNALFPAGDPGIDYLAIRQSKETPQPDGGGIGAFRTECFYSHMGYNDPLVFPGQPGVSHLHAFFGNTITDANSTSESLRTSGKSTCRGGLANRSAYWVPALIDTATGAPLKPARGSMYYKSGYGGVKPQDIKPFPQGLRMLAGNAKATTLQENAYWGCANVYLGKLASIPNCAAGDNVIMTVAFPQCWNGKDIDSTDHRSHMTYPTPGVGCPATHPVAIPEITFNIFYKVPSTGTAKWRLASDMYDASMPGGMSAHADYMEAWQPEIVKTWVTNCSNKALDCSSQYLGDGREIYYTDML